MRSAKLLSFPHDTRTHVSKPAKTQSCRGYAALVRGAVEDLDSFKVLLLEPRLLKVDALSRLGVEPELSRRSAEKRLPATGGQGLSGLERLFLFTAGQHTHSQRRVRIEADAVFAQHREQSLLAGTSDRGIVALIDGRLDPTVGIGDLSSALHQSNLLTSHKRSVCSGV
jgi:hypothetical protein